VLQQTDDREIYDLVAYSLEQIGYTKIIQALVQRLQYDHDYWDNYWFISNYWVISQAVKSLKKGLEELPIVGIITALKDYLSDEILKKDFVRFVDACYDVIWHCAQILSYPEFYQAWHNTPEVLETIAVGFTPTVQSLENQITDICNQINSSFCLCVNAQTLADMTDTAEIA
jgi:hypothetical protein